MDEQMGFWESEPPVRPLLALVRELGISLDEPGALERIGERLALETLTELMEEEVEELVGTRDRRRGTTGARRHSAKLTTVEYAGRRVRVRVPRVRKADGSVVTPPSYARFAERTQRQELIARSAAESVSKRGHERIFAADAEAPRAGERRALGGASGSTSQRGSKALMEDALEQIRTRDLSGLEPVVVLLDGKEVGRRTVVVAIAILRDGRKVVLDLATDQSETAAMVTKMLQRVERRGVALGRVLWLIDGGAGLRAAVKAIGGEHALVQRCVTHRVRNVLEALTFGPAPKGIVERKAFAAEKRERRAQVSGRLYAAWARPRVARVEQALHALAEELERDGQGKAADSVRRGVLETTTCTRLGVKGDLLRKLQTTNSIESMMRTIEQRIARIRRWTDDAMRERWVAFALTAAAASWTPVGGEQELTKLAGAVERQLQAAAAKPGA